MTRWPCIAGTTAVRALHFVADGRNGRPRANKQEQNDGVGTFSANWPDLDRAGSAGFQPARGTFSDEDWDDWEYEHSAEALERGRRGREQYARGEYLALDQIKRKYEID